MAIGFGYLLYEHPDTLGLCSAGELAAHCLSGSLFYGVANPLYLHIWPLPVLFLALAFVPKRVFVTWAWIAVPLGALGLLLIISAEPVSQGFGIMLLDRPKITPGIVKLFVLASVAVVALAWACELWRDRWTGRN